MKTACLTLVMIGCAVFSHGASLALSPNPAPQEQSSESSTRPPGSDHPTDASSPENGKPQKIRAHSDGQRTRRHIPDKNHSRNRVSLTKANRSRQPRNSRERSTPENGISVHQPSPIKPGGVAKIANHRAPSVRTAGTAALSGTQFKDSRNRGVAPAIIGGTASSTKGTAAINGTSINRRHVN